MKLNSPEGMKRFDNEIDKVLPTEYGFECHICGKKIEKAHDGEHRGRGFMRISMVGHIKKHFKDGDLV